MHNPYEIARRAARARFSNASRCSIDVSRAMGTVVVTVVGALDEDGSEQFATVVRDLVENQGNLSVEVDLGQVTVMDATGLAALVEAATYAGERGGQFLLRNSSGHLPAGDRRHPSPSRPPAHTWGVHNLLQLPGRRPRISTSEPRPTDGGEGAGP